MDECLTIGVGMTTIGSMTIGIFLASYQSIDVDLQDIVPHILRVIQLHLEILVITLLDDTFFLSIRDVGRISGVLSTTTDIQIVIMFETSLAGDGSQPITIIAHIVLCRLAVDDIMGIHEIEFLAPFREGHITVVANFSTSLALACLSGDQDHTIGTTRTIDSGCGSVLQHIDRGDVLSCYCVKVTFDTINQDQWGQVTYNGRDTTQTNRRGGTRVTTGVDHRQTGNLTFHEFCGIADLTCVEVLGLHRGDSRGNITLALGAVTDDDNLIQQGIVFLECHIAACLDLLGGETDVADDEGYIAVSNSERVVTVEVGNRCVLGALLSHRGADDRLALGVLDNTLH